MSIQKLFFLLVALMPAVVRPGYFFSEWLRLAPSVQTVAEKYAEQHAQLKALKDEFDRVSAGAQGVIAQAKKQQKDVQAQLKATTAQVAKAAFNNLSFVRSKESLLGDLDNTLAEYIRIYEQYVQDIKQAIDSFEQFLAHPTFENLHIADKASYTFDEYQNTATQLLGTQQELERLVQQKRHLDDDTQKNESLESQLGKKAQEKEFERQASAKNGNGVEHAHQRALLDLELRLAHQKQENAHIVTRSLEIKRLAIDVQILAAQAKIEIYKADAASVERHLWVHINDVQEAQSQFESKKQESDAKIAELEDAIKALTIERDAAYKKFEHINGQLAHPIKDVEQMQEWRFDVMQPKEYRAILAYEVYDTVQRKLFVTQAQCDAIKYQVMASELDVQELKTWLAYVQHTLFQDETVRQERVSYFTHKRAELDQALSQYTSQKATIERLMPVETRAVAHIKKHMHKSVSDFDKQENAAAMEKAYKEVNEQLDLSGQLIKVYAELIANISDMRQQTEAMLYKLESVNGIWRRTANAVTWDGMKSAGQDIRQFVGELVSVVSRKTVQELFAWGVVVLRDLFTLLNLLFTLILLGILYVVLHFGLPLLTKLLRAGTQSQGLRLVTSFLSAFFDFCRENLASLLLWSALFYAIRFESIMGVGGKTKLIFYLASAVYLCFLLRSFMRYYSKNNPTLLQDSFFRRFLWVLRFFLSATVVIYFVREAFLAVTYGHSEVPMLLLALYSIITRVSLIVLLMAKDVIIQALPKHGHFWGFVREYLERYYTFVLIAVIALIVMSDPFVGYSYLVTTVMQALVLTVMLFIGLWLLQTVFKHYSSLLFFEAQEEKVKERFNHAKTWYALFIVLSFAVVIIVALVALAKIWGYQASFDSVVKFLNIKIAQVQGEIVGQVTPITLGSLGILIAFVFGGFFIASVFTRYVLERIYQLLQIDVGIQSTISRISTYFIILLILIIGLQQIGLGGWIPVAVGLLAIGVAWAIRDPANDFIAYFIILVERSIKVGDYVRLEDSDGDQSGVVRKISPRSIVLRKKNSYNVVIPNSRVTKSIVYNWQYANTYFAFDDIKIVITYASDPVKAKEIILDILDKHHDILKNPPPIVRLNHFAINGFEFKVRAFMSIEHVSKQWDIRSDIRFELVREFAAHKIEFAVQSQDVRLTRDEQE